VRKKVVMVVPQSRWTSKDHLPSVGIAYIAAALEREGYDVSIVDCQVSALSLTDAAETIVGCKPDAVGLTASSHSRFWTIELAREIKRRGELLLFAGGVHFGLTGRDALQNVEEMDVIVKGEGEVTTPELLKAWFDGHDLGKVQGIIFRDDHDQIIENPDRAFIQDLNALPSPAWHLLDLDKYDARLEGCPGEDGKAVGVLSSRGCPFSCIFCANEAFWRRRLRRLAPERFVDQIEYLNRQYGFRDFDLWDDTFTVVEPHARNVCEEILRRGMDIRLYLRARVDTVNRDLLQLIKRAGGVAIGYGIESGSQRVLDNIDKGITVSRAESTVKMSLDLGYFVKAFFMTSLPGETLKDVEMTLELVENLRLYGGNRISIGAGFPTIIYPGTKIESMAKELGLLPTDFSWNTYHEFETTSELGLNPTLPCFENPGLPLKEILRFRHSRGGTRNSKKQAQGGDRLFKRLGKKLIRRFLK
jgi:anaerobic magnesium-protoporphyrin IX monomethyl ester cyclase